MKTQLQQIRTMAGYKKRKDFANAIDESIDTVKAWELGSRSYTLEKAVELADFLDCSLDELAGREEFMNRYADERQQTLNNYFNKMDDKERDYAVASLHGMVAHSNSRDVEEGADISEAK